nr:unnamed protein product [Callosobruchus analis]
MQRSALFAHESSSQVSYNVLNVNVTAIESVFLNTMLRTYRGTMMTYISASPVTNLLIVTKMTIVMSLEEVDELYEQYQQEHKLYYRWFQYIKAMTNN